MSVPKIEKKKKKDYFKEDFGFSQIHNKQAKGNVILFFILNYLNNV